MYRAIFGWVLRSMREKYISPMPDPILKAANIGLLLTKNLGRSSLSPTSSKHAFS